MLEDGPRVKPWRFVTPAKQKATRTQPKLAKSTAVCQARGQARGARSALYLPNGVGRPFMHWPQGPRLITLQWLQLTAGFAL